MLNKTQRKFMLNTPEQVEQDLEKNSAQNLQEPRLMYKIYRPIKFTDSQDTYIDYSHIRIIINLFDIKHYDSIPNKFKIILCQESFIIAEFLEFVKDTNQTPENTIASVCGITTIATKFSGADLEDDEILLLQ
jgi:hypothetical protein